MTNRSTGADVLRGRLEALGWSQNELARRLDVSPSVVCRWMSGERKPSLDVAFRIEASEVGMPASAWLDDPVDSDAAESGSANATGTTG